MNFSQYSNYYGQFHSIFEAEIHETCIFFRIARVSWSKSIILKLKNYLIAYDDKNTKPLTTALMKFFKLETISTVFKTDDSFSILFGNALLAYPKSEENICVVATEYFVNDSASFKQFMSSLKAECVHDDGVYFYKSAVFYIDPFDIPYPGGDYFSKFNTKNEIARICIIIDQQDLFRIREFVSELENIKNIFYISQKSKCVNASVSPFLELTPISETFIPTIHYEYTNIVVKRLSLKNPNFILQDILNSCFKSADFGIVMEYPICLSYVSQNPTNQPRRFVCFAINCHQPKKFIFTSAPYDRYYEYNHGIKDIEWTTFYYDSVDQNSIEGIKDVIISTNTIGYVYRNTFFCLSHPKLSKFINEANKNTNYLTNTLSFDINEDKNLNIISQSRLGSHFTIHCVKHNDLPFEMYCLEKSKEINYKHAKLPYLVTNWAELVMCSQNRETLSYGDLNFIRLMYIISQHKICYNTRESNKEREIIYEKHSDIIFEVEEKAIEFINNIRLDLMKTNESKTEESCIIS